MSFLQSFAGYLLDHEWALNIFGGVLVFMFLFACYGVLYLTIWILLPSKPCAKCQIKTKNQCPKCGMPYCGRDCWTTHHTEEACLVETILSANRRYRDFLCSISSGMLDITLAPSILLTTHISLSPTVLPLSPPTTQINQSQHQRNS